MEDLRGVNGFDEESFIAAHQQDANLSVRLHPIKGVGMFADKEPVTWCNGGLYLDKRPVFTLDPAYHAGAYYVQEASSMFLSHLLKEIFADNKGLRVLDLCAAPGGKSTLIASMLDRDSLLISNDVIRTRASILEENMSRWGYMNTWVTSNDPRDFGRLDGFFDVIVVDAPCSGSGLWRKDAAALNEWSEANVQMCSQRQQRILADVLPALKDEGVLVYATCSFSPQEDEEVLGWLAGEFDVESIATAINPGWGIDVVSSPQKGMTGYRFFPGKVKGEGFFIAAIRKKGIDREQGRPAKFKTENNKKIADAAMYLLGVDDAVFIPSGDDMFSAILPQHEVDLQTLRKVVYLRKTGIEVGQPTTKEWLPAHDVALSVDANKNLPSIDANREQALKFLKREEMGIEGIEKGWYIVKYNGLGLGWVKALGNRMNNYLPKQWRIRMDIDSFE